MNITVNYAVHCAYVDTKGVVNQDKSVNNLSLKGANAQYLKYLSTYTPNPDINQVIAFITDCFGNIVRKEVFDNLNPFVEDIDTDTTAAAV